MYIYAQMINVTMFGQLMKIYNLYTLEDLKWDINLKSKIEILKIKERNF